MRAAKSRHGTSLLIIGAQHPHTARDRDGSIEPQIVKKRQGLLRVPVADRHTVTMGPVSASGIRRSTRRGLFGYRSVRG